MSVRYNTTKIVVYSHNGLFYSNETELPLPTIVDEAGYKIIDA